MAFRWTPPAKSVLVFNVDAFDGPYHESRVPKGGITVRQRDAALRELFERFGLKKSESFTRLSVDDPRLPELLSAISKLREQRVLALKSAWVEEPAPRASDPHAWFELGSGPSEFKSATRAPANSHFGYRDGQHVASELFQRVVTDNGLTGLAWLPLEDSRPDDSVLWHEVYAQHPIGRALDHPLIDPAKFEASKRKYKFDRTRRWGEPVAWFKDFRNDAVIDHAVIAALAASSTPYFRVQGCERHVREHLPPTDFAYRHWGFNADTGPGHKGRPIRSICCNARARGILINAGAMKASRFTAMATVPASEAVSEILDRTVAGPIPPPIYTPVEAAAELDRRKASMTSRAPPAPILRFESTDAAAAYLTKRIADGTATWVPAHQTADFDSIRASKLFSLTPAAWQRLAPMLPMEAAFHDEATDESFDFCMQEPEWNDWLAYEPGAGPPEDEPSKDDLLIARTPYGDWFAFRKDDLLLPGDARIVHWDHETTGISEEWPCVAALAAHIVGLCDRKVKEARG